MSGLLLGQIRSGVDYIEEHLHEEMNLRSISRAAAMSHSSFQRAFKAVTGETLKRYVRARRLSHALDLLESTELRVIDIAMVAGYETQESFAKVFKSTVGITPSQYRRGVRARPLLKKARINDAYLAHLDSGKLSAEPVIQHRDELSFVGVSTRFDGDGRQRNTLGSDIDDLWTRFLPAVATIPEQVEGPYYGVIRDAAGDDDGLDYLAAVHSTAQSVPDGLDTEVVRAGRWAMFEHRGLPSDIDHTVDYIYGSWLMRSNHDHAGGPDLEIYGPEWRHDSPESVIHYAIPIR